MRAQLSFLFQKITLKETDILHRHTGPLRHTCKVFLPYHSRWAGRKTEKEKAEIVMQTLWLQVAVFSETCNAGVK